MRSVKRLLKIRLILETRYGKKTKPVPPNLTREDTEGRNQDTVC